MVSAVAVPDEEAPKAGLVNTHFAISAPALAAFARYNLINGLHNQNLEEVRELDWVTKWEKTGLLQFTDKNEDGRIQLRPNKEESEIKLDKDIIVLSTPEVAGLAPWVIALVAAGGLAAALSTASGLLLVVSSSIAHDIYYRLINPKASEKKRVFVGRIMIVAAIFVAGYFGINPPDYVASVVAFAFGLAAASFFPAIVLGIFDKRMNRNGAVTGMIIGLGFTVFYIIANKFYGMTPWFGISSEGIGTVGMILNSTTALIVSRLSAPPPQEVQDMVESLRSPDHPGPATILDEDSEEFH